jgi:hypothetical protein
MYYDIMVESWNSGTKKETAIAMQQQRNHGSYVFYMVHTEAM